MIKERYVNFEIAKLLEQKGFDEYTDTFYNRNSGEVKDVLRPYLKSCDIRRPTYQMVIDWIKEGYKLYIGIILTYDNPRKYEAHIMNLEKCDDVVLCPEKGFSSDLEAIDAAIKYILEK